MCSLLWLVVLRQPEIQFAPFQAAYFTIYAAVYLIFACVVKAEDSLKMGFRLKSLQNL